MKMNANLLIYVLSLHFVYPLYYLDRRPSDTLQSPDAQFQRYDVPRHQPPFQVIDRNIHKRRLDVWVPLDDDSTTSKPKLPKTKITDNNEKEVVKTPSVFKHIAPVYQ